MGIKRHALLFKSTKLYNLPFDNKAAMPPHSHCLWISVYVLYILYTPDTEICVWILKLTTTWALWIITHQVPLQTFLYKCFHQIFMKQIPLFSHVFLPTLCCWKVCMHLCVHTSVCVCILQCVCMSVCVCMCVCTWLKSWWH